jgi:hypothetical protein
VVQLNLRFKVERESEPGSVEEVGAPCKGAWPGAYVDESGHPHIDWFVTLDDVPAELDGHPVSVLESRAEGVAGHLLILDRS